MGIVDEDVRKVRDATDIVAVISEHVALKRVGRRWQGLCPFHAERSPSFSVNGEEGLYYCLAGETRVLTWDGVVPIRELAGRTVKVLSEKGRWIEAPFRSFGVQPLMRIELSRNRQRKVIHATPEHRWILSGGAEVRTECLSAGDELASVYGDDRLRHRRLPDWTVRTVEATERVEEVFCATVPETHNFVLEDNILTGNCFGCHAKGDAITFVREIEHLDFPNAVERLAQKAGVALRYDDGEKGSEDRKQRKRLLDVMEKAVEFYHQRLLSSDDAAVARSYLRSRGYDGDVVRKYRIGWAPDDWDALARHLKQPEKVMVDAGLAFTNKRNRQQDVFRGRVLFPIFDPSGAPVAFGGRILPGTDGPKYKNSSETKLYSKSSVLYALNWSKAGIVAEGEAVVCEGYTDVIGLAVAGVERGVATCGTALTGEHLRLLKRFANRIVFAFDADAAGQAAAERVYEWETQLDLEVRVAALPAGSDPGDLARKDPDALRAAIADARPFLGFRVERALAAADLSTPEGRARGADDALDMIREHPSDLVRDQYLMTVADQCRLDPAMLRQRMAAPRRKAEPQAPQRRPVPVDEQVADGPETEALRLCIHQRDEILPLLDDVLFEDDRCLAAFRALVDHVGVRDAAEHADPGAAALLQRLAVEEPTAEAEDVAVRLAEVAVQRSLNDIQREARASGAPLEWADTLKWLKVVGEHLRDPNGAQEAVAQLVTWLQSRAEEQE